MNKEGTTKINGRPLAFPTEEKLRKEVDKYFDKCDSNERPYTVEGLAKALKVTRKTLINYESYSERFLHILQEAKDKINEQRIVYGLRGDYKEGLVRFLLSNQGYDSEQRINVTTQPISFNEISIEQHEKLLNDLKEQL